MILAGDIGGTKTNLALYDDRLKLIFEKSFPSRDFEGLETIVRLFRSEMEATSRATIPAARSSIDHAAFGIAGPVVNGQSRTTNLPWLVDARTLANDLNLPTVGLINDLEANAYGIAALGASDFVVLNEGVKEARGNQAVIAAGTGLGEAGLFWDGLTHRPFACEGGHASFAPTSELEIELLRFLHGRFGRTSWERLVSGSGIPNIYAFLKETGRAKESPLIAARMQTEDPSAVISKAALARTDDLCIRTLDLFTVLYGSEAGDLALKMMATGGVFVGGGVAPKIIEKLKDGAFMTAFVAKGRMRPLLEAMPVRVILNDKTALLGAARYATLAH